MKKVQKRDGSIVSFDLSKVAQAISKAAQSTGEISQSAIENVVVPTAMDLINKHILRSKKKEIGVEEIQDIIEDLLWGSQYRKTAKAFINYREQHRQLREIVASASVDMVEDYLSKLDWQVNENSNMAYSIQGLNNYLASAMNKNYWLHKIYSEPVREAHLSGDIHIHDLNIISTYCVGWDLKDLLMEGFKGVEGKVESAPAKHFRTALGQIVNFMYTMQGEAAGAQAFSNFDTLLAPFVKQDQLNYAQVKQALQEFIFNMNVPTRVGFQTPFTNVTMDLTVPSYLAEQGVIVGGEVLDITYAECQAEIDMINKAFFEVMMEGDNSGRIFTFPIPTYNITKDFDWDNPELRGLWEITAKYGIPNFSNFINSDLNPEDSRSMCCRLRIDNRILESRGGGLFGSNPLTGSIGVVTINLPRIGFYAESEEQFFIKLKKNMDLAKDSLEVKRKILENLTTKNLYPYTKFYLRDIYEGFGQYWKNHFSTIGLIGMNEACINLLGVGIETEEGKSFALRVMDYMRETIVAYQETTGNIYNLEATPAEGTSHRLALKDKERNTQIVCANQTDYEETHAAPYYTNSTQLPVNYTDDVFEALDHQDAIQTKYTGGTTFHVFAGERVHDLETMKKLVKTICSQYHLPYFTFSPTFSTCPSHGYLNGKHATCPKCGAPCEVYSRVVGYIRPVKQWNNGKRQEFKDRQTFDRTVEDCVSETLLEKV